MIRLRGLSCIYLLFLASIRLVPLVNASSASDLDDQCPGYNAVNVQVTETDLTADLILAGEPCDIYGKDIQKLFLRVEYQTDSRIRVRITDAFQSRYEVPESVFPRPKPAGNPFSPTIKFRFATNPFAFSVLRVETNEVLFDTENYPLIFAPQYIRLKTTLPANANIYGLGEHTDSFRLPIDRHHTTTRTLWNRDSFGISPGTNLYGAHPIYFDHRTTGTHGVFMLNSNGMDIKLRKEDGDHASLEYNMIGGAVDLYFLAGPNPVDVARQYAIVAGMPAEIPYWSLGLHQCRFGYKDIDEVKGVIANYSAAGIPLETMWIDIDYMDDRLVFTTDPNKYPKNQIQKVVKQLHEDDQHFIMMVDPAVGTRSGQAGAYDRGTQLDVWVKGPDGKPHVGIVWPGATVFPDWFHPSANAFWTEEFKRFFDPKDGFDIDGVWIDMNEPASFCYPPCNLDPEAVVDIAEVMLTLDNIPPLEDVESEPESEELNLNRPPYAIQNALPRLSDRTVPVDAVHHNGLLEYDTHNLYGSMMSIATREAMLARKPDLRPFIITRSTFAGIGSKTGKWLGDNISNWDQYRFSIAGMLGFASIYQVPMVGSDVCGFYGNATESLCARWAMLGAFSPFYRNHNDIASIPQEFYRWPAVARAAKVAVAIRYRLLDYLYTAFHKAHLDGTPVVQPLFFAYPEDSATFGIEHQFLFGDGLMVSPALDESNEVEIYLPDDIYYEFTTRRILYGPGAKMWVRQVELDEIPLLVRGGTIIPMREESAMTTKELRKKDFELVVAPGSDWAAKGSLYLDDGVSLEQASTLEVSYAFDATELTVTAAGRYNVNGVKYSKISILGISERPLDVKIALASGKPIAVRRVDWDAQNEVVNVDVAISLSTSFTLQLEFAEADADGESAGGHAHDEL
ncbi:hypothetical protein FRC18_001947 [Serendipita sp. 400]|nr:hypothetical protein FRC18_001947 [Serendipita sp. 400]